MTFQVTCELMLGGKVRPCGIRLGCTISRLSGKELNASDLLGR